MENQVYDVESQLEENHWWFVARREMFKKYISSLNLNKDAKILDVGSSSGTNLRLLKDMGFVNYNGFDMSELSKNFCESKGLGEVIIGDITNSKLESDQYDLVLATDILEHIDDDVLALSEVERILKPSGVLIVTVPTFEILWGLQDVVSMHKRRYLIAGIKAKVSGAKLNIIDSYYFNFIMFVPIFLVRKFIYIFKINLESEVKVTTKFLNKTLKILFLIDMLIAKHIKVIPFGVSAFVMAKKGH